MTAGLRWALPFAFMLFLLLLIRANLAAHPFPFVAMDEQAHYSYARELVLSGRWWPDFTHFPLYDTHGMPTQARNYMSHPPMFYWPVKFLPHAAASTYRGIALLMVGASLILYILMGLRAQSTWPRLTLYSMAPFLLTVATQTGFYSNDAAVLFGGSLFCLGSYLWLQQKRRALSGGLMAIGLLFAAMKLTGLLLIVLYAFFLLLQVPSAQRPGRRGFIAAVLLLALVCLPYVIFLWQWGSPVPLTPGQEDLFHYWAVQHHAAGNGPPSWGHWLGYAMTVSLTPLASEPVPPLILLVAGLLAVSGSRGNRSIEAAITRAALFSSLSLLLFAMGYAWEHYRDTGWTVGLYLRFFFPLLPAYGVAFVFTCLHLRSFFAKRDAWHGSNGR